jgi:hypothetical protein
MFTVNMTVFAVAIFSAGVDIVIGVFWSTPREKSKCQYGEKTETHLCLLFVSRELHRKRPVVVVGESKRRIGIGRRHRAFFVVFIASEVQANNHRNNQYFLTSYSPVTAIYFALAARQMQSIINLQTFSQEEVRAHLKIQTLPRFIGIQYAPGYTMKGRFR